MKRKTECKECRGTMYSDRDIETTECIWKCACCGHTEKRHFRISKKRQEREAKISKIFAEFGL